MGLSVVVVGGVTLDPATSDIVPVACTPFVANGIPTFTLARKGGDLPGLPDPVLGKTIQWTYNGTLYFDGDVIDFDPDHSNGPGVGWTCAYQCQGLRGRLDWFPHTDANTGLDSSGFNLAFTDSANYIASRAGRTHGQILTAVLTMVANAGAINAHGIGNYTGLPSAPVLPASTVADLATLTIIPQQPQWFGGEKMGGAIEGYLAEAAPNYCFWVAPNGDMRFLDTRAFTPHTLTMGTDPIENTPLRRSLSDAFQRVLVRGQPIAEGIMLTLLNGGLLEDFTWGPYGTNAAAKAAWTPANYTQPGTASDNGTCTCPSTTTVTVTSASGTTFWGVNFHDQTSTGRHTVINLIYTLGTGITSRVSRKVIANTALVAGGTSTLTVEYPLPVTAYDSYSLELLQDPSSVVWRLYKAADAAIGAALVNSFTADQPFRNSDGSAASLVSGPTASVVWGGGPAYNEFPIPFTQDPSSGTFLMYKPTWMMANNAAPHDVRVLAAVNKGVNQAVWPADIAGVPQYAGTSHTVERETETLTVTCNEWRDPANQTNMNAYASDILDSVKDTIVEGTVRLYGMLELVLKMGVALNIADTGGPATGWEAINAPILETRVTWPGGDDGSQIVIDMHCSNRRAHYTAARFLAPDRTGLTGLDTQSAGGVYRPSGPQSSPTAGALSDLMAGPQSSSGPLPVTPSDLGLPTNPGDYLAGQGAPTSPSQMGLPTGPSDLGLPTAPGAYLQGQGLPTGQTPAGQANQDRAAAPPPPADNTPKTSGGADDVQAGMEKMADEAYGPLGGE